MLSKGAGKEMPIGEQHLSTERHERHDERLLYLQWTS